MEACAWLVYAHCPRRDEEWCGDVVSDKLKQIVISHTMDGECIFRLICVHLCPQLGKRAARLPYSRD